MSFSQSLSIDLHPFLSWYPSSDKNSVFGKLLSSSSNLFTAPSPKVRSLDPLGKTSHVLVLVVLIVVGHASDKGHGSGVVEPPHHVHPCPHLQIHTPASKIFWGQRFAGHLSGPDPHKRFLLPNYPKRPTVVGVTNRTYLRSCWSRWVAVEVDGGDDGVEGVGAEGLGQGPWVPSRGPWVSRHPRWDTIDIPPWRSFCRQILRGLLPVCACFHMRPARVITCAQRVFSHGPTACFHMGHVGPT